MQLNYLRYLIAIKKYGSMNKAAEHLFTTQQNISNAIKQIEGKLGYKLFAGTTRKPVFTDEGEKLYEFALEYDMKYKILREKLVEKTTIDIKGVVSIGAMSTGSAMLLPQILVEYYKKYPNVQFHVVDGAMKNLIEKLVNNEIDMAIVLSAQIDGLDYIDLPEEIEPQLLAVTRSCCWMSKKNPLVKLKEISAVQMVQHPVIVHTGTDMEMMQKVFEAYGGKLNVIIENENPYILSEFVANGAGVLLDVSIIDGEWMMKYAFSDRNDVLPVSISSENGYGSKLYLLTNRYHPSNVLREHVIKYILSGGWKK